MAPWTFLPLGILIPEEEASSCLLSTSCSTFPYTPTGGNLGKFPVPLPLHQGLCILRLFFSLSECRCQSWCTLSQCFPAPLHLFTPPLIGHYPDLLWCSKGLFSILLTFLFFLFPPPSLPQRCESHLDFRFWKSVKFVYISEFRKVLRLWVTVLCDLCACQQPQQKKIP